MTSDSSPNEPDVDLSEKEKARIRAEVRYAASVAKEVAKEAVKEARPPEKSKTTLEKIVSSSAFSVLLGAVLVNSQKVLVGEQLRNSQAVKAA